MGWLAKGVERDDLLSALRQPGSIYWKPEAIRFITELDAERFTQSALLELAAAQVADPSRRVHRIEDHVAAEGSQPPTEPVWYAVEIQCDDLLVFFKVAFRKDSFSRLVVASLHPQKEPWRY